MMVKAIFFDIDGTLLSFKTHKVPQSTIDAINAVKQKGIKVIIATGRLLGHIRNLDGIEFDGFVTVNGSYSVSTDGQIIGKRTIDRKDLESLIAYEKNVMPFAYSFMLNEGMYVNRIDEVVQSVCDIIELPLPEVKDLTTLLDEDVYQLNLFVDHAIESQIMQNALNNCETSRWNPIYSDVNIKNINKRIGIDDFLKYYNIDRSETMAFGDGGNDIEMLKHVAIGIAMGNAGDDVKAVADYVTTTIDDDGVANALRHFGLI